MRKRWVATLAPSLVTVGCAVGPDFHRPAARTDPRYTPEVASATAVADGKGQRFNLGQSVAGTWWKLLHSPALDAMIAAALAGNEGLEAARATLRQSQDNLRAGYGVFFPQLDAKAGAGRELYNPAPGTLPSKTFNLFTLSGTVSYALDIWGGERRQVEALAAAVDAQRFTLAGATVMLSSNVADTVIAQAAYRDEIDATKATLFVLDEQVRIAKAQEAGGTVPYANVLSLRSQQASTEATLPPLEEKIDQATDLLAELSGTTPFHWKGPQIRLSDLQLPEDVPLTVPSQLVRQRPDILMAEANLHAANAAIGVATAAMLPNLTLSAGLGVNSTSVADLFGLGSPFWSLGAGLTQPIFHGGALYYQRKAAIDARDAAAATYRQTVLGAFQQVVDTLRALGHDADALIAQTEAVETAERALRLLQVNYQAGIATYLQLLVADEQYLQAKTGYVQAVAQRLQDTVALYVALGGGWWDMPSDSHG
ncbi:MAG: efflux transporter outer membrane subunit [Polyangiaceae bacterium]|jgi:NodT family efflux transporter outer membrane factor (OMF) lipoprotein